MEITFKNLHHVPRASEGTLFYSATVVLDGEPCFTAKNTGQGKPDIYRPLSGQKGRFEALETQMKQQNTTLEKYLHAALRLELARREMVKRLATHSVYVEQGVLYEIKKESGDGLAMARTYLKSKHPKAVLLNDMDEAEALKIWIITRKPKGNRQRRGH